MGAILLSDKTMMLRIGIELVLLFGLNEALKKKVFCMFQSGCGQEPNVEIKVKTMLRLLMKLELV